MTRKEISEAVSNMSPCYIEEAANFKAKRQAPIWAKWFAVAAAVCLAAGFGAFAIGKLGNNSETPKIPQLNVETTTAAETGNASVATDATTEAATTAAPTGQANAAPGSGSVTTEEEPWEKTYPKTAEQIFKEWKAGKAQAELEAREALINWNSLEAAREELLASAGGSEENLTEEQKAELARIDAAMEVIWFEHGLVLEYPDFYEPATELFRRIEQCIGEAKWMMKVEPLHSSSYYRGILLIEMADEMLRMYEAGEDIDTINLFYFTELEEINGIDVSLGHEYEMNPVDTLPVEEHPLYIDGKTYDWDQRVADVLAYIAEKQEFTEEINRRKQELDAAREELLKSVDGDEAALSEELRLELETIDSELYEIRLNYGHLIVFPDYYDDGVFLGRMIEKTSDYASYLSEKNREDSPKWYMSNIISSLCLEMYGMRNRDFDHGEIYRLYFEKMTELFAVEDEAMYKTIYEEMEPVIIYP